MGFDRGHSFPLDFEPNRIPFGSKSKGKLSPRSYPIQFERNWKYSFLSDVSALRRLAPGFFVPGALFLGTEFLLPFVSVTVFLLSHVYVLFI